MSCTITSTLNRYCSADILDNDHVNIVSEIYRSSVEVNREEWSEAITHNSSFLSLDYLTSLERAHDEGLEIRYVIFRKKEKVVGAGAFQITHFTTSEDAYQNGFLKLLNRIAGLIRGRHIHNILICGNAIATGEHGYSFNCDIDQKNTSLLIADVMKRISEQEKENGKKICAMVVKDFYPDSVGVAEELSNAGFKKFQVDHNMVMPVLKDWTTFNHYLESMNTKFRTKAKAALKKSSQVEIESHNSVSITGHLDRLEQLYTNVYSKADFRLGKLSMSTLPLLLDQIPGAFTAKTYSVDGTIAGFMTAMRCGNVLEAHVIGIDYELNKEHAIYQRMLYDYVDLAIEQKCDRIVFGRTAAEIKSTVGAFPIDLTCCILHQQRISNALLSLILNYVKPSEYPQRQPYKAEVLDQIKEVKLDSIVV